MLVVNNSIATFSKTLCRVRHRAIRCRVQSERAHSRHFCCSPPLWLSISPTAGKHWPISCQNNKCLSANRRHYCRLIKIPFPLASAKVLLDQDGFACKLSPATICVVESKGTTESWLAIAEDASDSEIFDALFKMAFSRKWPNGLEVSKFRHEKATMGWSLQINQLDVDEWRYRSREKWT
ncbi:hypothetical protein niasHT_014668 [Heterodera trifolii]|uniref:Uncharacterized protein n=1 Tax=Heterodera trifolii TaxID=157864 RepID=A0ABD2LI40_9BILA